jgi:hypothetical protein
MIGLEIWKDIKGYDGLYQVSNLGRVKSFVIMPNGKILKPSIDNVGYSRNTLTKNKKPKHIYTHRLVAQAFIKNPKNKATVNHKDGNKLNNVPSNLEWCTQKENLQHAHKTGLFNFNKNKTRFLKVLKKRRKPIIMLTIDDVYIKEFDCAKYAYEETKINNITNCCLGKRKTAGGYKWKFKLNKESE